MITNLELLNTPFFDLEMALNRPLQLGDICPAVKRLGYGVGYTKYPLLHFAVAAGANEAVINSLHCLGATFTNAADAVYSRYCHRNLPVLAISILWRQHHLTHNLLAQGAEPLVIPPDSYVPEMQKIGDPNAAAALQYLGRARGAKKEHQAWTLDYKGWEQELQNALIPIDKYWLTRAVMMRPWSDSERWGDVGSLLQRERFLMYYTHQAGLVDNVY